MFISNDVVSIKSNDKCDDFYFEIVIFPFLDGDGPRCMFYGIYISQLIRFTRAMLLTSTLAINLFTQKLLKQGYRYHKVHKMVSKFYC